MSASYNNVRKKLVSEKLGPRNGLREKCPCHRDRISLPIWVWLTGLPIEGTTQRDMNNLYTLWRS